MQEIWTGLKRNGPNHPASWVNQAEGDFTFDITRNGQDYSGDGQAFAVYGLRRIDYIEPGSGPAIGGIVVSLYDSMRNFVNSTDLEIRFGTYEPGGEGFEQVRTLVNTSATKTTPDTAWTVVPAQRPQSPRDCATQVNTSDVTLASMWHEPNLWDVVYRSPTEISTVNPYRGQVSAAVAHSQCY